MKNFAAVTVLMSALAVAAPVLAQSQNDENIKSDVQAIDKDNAALQNDQDKLARHRMHKADDKANESYGSQAVDSMKIGADKAAIEEKRTERGVDKKILRHHKRKAKKNYSGDARTSN